MVKEAREALARGDKKTYDKKKKSLPFVIFIATYDESDKEIENKQTGEKSIKRGTWRNQEHCRLNGLCVIDFDHVDEGEADQTTPPSGHPSYSGGESCASLPSPAPYYWTRIGGGSLGLSIKGAVVQTFWEEMTEKLDNYLFVSGFFRIFAPIKGLVP